MKIFLTGSSGFIGRNILESLSGKYELIAPGHGELDLTDEAAVKDFFSVNSIDVVIHGAVKAGHRNVKDPSNQLYDNTRMFFNIARNCGKFGKMIFLGSGAVYDMRHYRPRMPEDYFDAHVPVDEHGFSKYIIAKYIQRQDNIIELRLFGVFGKYEDYAIRFISNAICKALFGLPVTIKQNRFFDYLYIDDLMPVLEYFIHNGGRNRSYNLTPGKAVDLLTIARKVLDKAGKDLPVVVGEDGLGPEYSADNSRLVEEIPGLEFTPLDEAIGRLYDWYASNIDSIDKARLLVDK